MSDELKTELNQLGDELTSILNAMLEDLPQIAENKAAARRVRSGLTKIKKTGKELRRVSLEFDKTK